MVDSLRYLQNVGEQVQQSFLRNKTILAFQEYMEAYFERPRVHARDAAQYIRDCFDFYGSETVQRSSGRLSRSLNSITPRFPATSGPYGSNNARFCSAPGSAPWLRSWVTCR